MQTFELQNAGPGQAVMLFTLAFFCLVIAFVLWHLRPDRGAAAAAMYIGILTCVGIAGLMMWFYIGQTRATVQIGTNQISVNVPLYGRDIPMQHIRADEVEQISLSPDEPRRPIVRTNGLGLPGFSLGWFRTRGGEQALVAITTPEVVVVPTDDGYLLILSVVDADGFVRSLRADLRGN